MAKVDKHKELIMMKDYGLVSIIMPNFNCAKFLPSAIESVLAQTYQNWELLIQDDGSADNSTSVAVKYAMKDCRIKIQQNNCNCGTAVTRNNAIRRSKGLWLAFLDSDDVWLPEKLERQLEFMTENGCSFSFHEYEHMSEDDEPSGLVAKVVRRLTYRGMMIHNWPGCLTVMARQDVDNKVYADDGVENDDTVLFLRMLKTRQPAMGLPECLARYRVRSGSASRNKLKLVRPFVSALVKSERQNVLFACFCVMSHSIVKMFMKYRRR